MHRATFLHMVPAPRSLAGPALRCTVFRQSPPFGIEITHREPHDRVLRRDRREREGVEAELVSQRSADSLLVQASVAVLLHHLAGAAAPQRGSRTSDAPARWVNLMGDGGAIMLPVLRHSSHVPYFEWRRSSGTAFGQSRANHTCDVRKVGCNIRERSHSFRDPTSPRWQRCSPILRRPPALANNLPLLASRHGPRRAYRCIVEATPGWRTFCAVLARSSSLPPEQLAHHGTEPQ
jgi:hypothetical protein